MHRSILTALFLWLIATLTTQAQDWPVYGGDDGGSRFSQLTQIDRDNVANLALAWSYQTGHIALHPEVKEFLHRPIRHQ